MEVAKTRDQSDYENAKIECEEAYKDWEEAKILAERILARGESAYIEALEETNPFSDISALGSSLSFTAHDQVTIEVTLHVNDEGAVPSEVKSLLQSGKLSVKKMPKGAFFELYQDYICSCTIRIAREIYALLPVHMVVIQAMGDILNSKTGHMDEQTILSVAIPRGTLERMNLETIDPSDSMRNFVHNMEFKRNTGFRATKPIDISSLQQTGA